MDPIIVNQSTFEMSQPPLKSVIIIGSGLGGLTLAQALKRYRPDLKVSVFERDATNISRAQGYQIGLNADGIAALKQVQLPKLKELLFYNPALSFAVVDYKYRVLLQMASNERTDEYPPFALVNRWSLRELLAEGIEVQWNKKFIRYEEFPDKVVAHFSDNTTAEADLLIGADGSNSKVRKQRCPNLEYQAVGVSNVAGFLDMPEQSTIPHLYPLLQVNALRVLGYGGYSFLLLPFKDDNKVVKLLWAFTHLTADNIPKDPSELKKFLINTARYPNPEELAVVFEKTPEKNLLGEREVHSIKPVSGNPMGKTTRVTLLGDAAHSMTTHAGLGKYFRICI